jgi:hypothetical protein
MSEFIYYYFINHKYYYVKETGEEMYCSKSINTKKYRGSEVLKSFKAPKSELLDAEDIRQSLLAYRVEFNRCNDEIKSKSKKAELDWKTHNSNGHSVYRIFWAYTNYKIESVLKIRFDKVNCFEELLEIEKCYNAGKTYINPDIINVPTQCYGYDYSSFYGHLMGADFSKFQFPIGHGKTVMLTDDSPLTKAIHNRDITKLSFGIYHMKIVSRGKQANKNFTFNPNNRYTYYDLQFAFMYQTQFEFEFSELKSAYIYPNSKMVYSSNIFGDWFNPLMKLKTKCSKNMLTKHPLTSLHGILSAFKIVSLQPDDDTTDVTDFDDDEESDYKFIRGNTEHDNNGNPCCENEMVSTSDPYRHAYARLKPFLTSYGRFYVGRFIMDNGLFDSVLRIHTDGIVLSQEFDFSHLINKGKYVPIPEAKNTGILTWLNVTYNNKSDEKRKRNREVRQMLMENLEA